LTEVDLNANRIYLGGLWRNKSQRGVDYLSGRFGRARLLVFRNEKATGDNAPDFSMYLVADDRDAGAAESGPAGSTAAPPPSGPPITDDTVPF
jgi:uncharacterized protein (DUF736 family)